MTWGDLFRWLQSPKGTVGVAAVLAAAFALGGAIAEDGLFGQVTAAWVQAIGSIAAISAAIWIAGRQFRQSEIHRWEADASRVSVALHLSAQLRDAIDEAQRSVLPRLPTFEPSNFESVRAALDEVPLMELPAGKAAIAVVNLRRAAQLYEATYRSWVKACSHWEKAQSFTGTEELKDKIVEALEAHEREMARIQHGVSVSHGELVDVDAALTAMMPR